MALARKPFVVIDAEILSSSVWGSDDHMLRVWLTLLILCDTEGYVGAAIPGIARAANVTLEQAEDAMKRLQEPDPYSRTKANEGRRVAPAERGWQVLNFVEHVDRLSKERQKSRERTRRWRDKKRHGDASTVTGDGTVTQGTGNRDKGTESREGERKTETSHSAPVSPRVEALWSLYKQHLGCSDRMSLDAKRRRKLEQRIKEGRTDEEFRLAFTGCATSTFHRENHHTDLELICRDATHFDRFVEMGRSVGRPVLSEGTLKTRDVLRNFLERHKEDTSDFFGGFGQGVGNAGGSVQSAAGRSEGRGVSGDPLPADD